MTQPLLTQHVGLGRSVVAARIAELEAAGLVVQAGMGPSTGGRAPRQLRLRAEAGVVVGVDIGATSMEIGLADLGGHVLDHVEEPVDVADGPEAVLSRVEQVIDEVMERNPGIGAIWGVGIGVPGPVEFSAGSAGGAADHAGLGRLPGPRALRRRARRARSGSTTTSTCWRSAS